MFLFSHKITKKFALDFTAFHLLRSFKDGITFFEFDVNLDLYEQDHNPKFRIVLIALNFKLFEFEIYNINHVHSGEI
jgi:hypothetical protein